MALQAQVHADGPRYKRLRNIKQKIAADLEHVDADDGAARSGDRHHGVGGLVRRRVQAASTAPPLPIASATGLRRQRQRGRRPGIGASSTDKVVGGVSAGSGAANAGAAAIMRIGGHARRRARRRRRRLVRRLQGNLPPTMPA